MKHKTKTSIKLVNEKIKLQSWNESKLIQISHTSA